MKKFLLFFTLSFLFGIHSAFAGLQDTAKVISFRAIDAVTGNPVEMAYAVNITHKSDAIADKLGYFKIPILDGDSISISSIGYFSELIYSWGQYSYDSTFYIIQMKPRSYQLKELKISWFSTYDKFLKGVSLLKLPMTKEEESNLRIAEYFRKVINNLNLKGLPGFDSGMMFGVDWLTKQNQKLAARLEMERIHRAVERKYSAGIVSALTGLYGNEVHWFMEYCALTDDYILKTSDYDIRAKIMDKFKIYSIDKSPKEKK